MTPEEKAKELHQKCKDAIYMVIDGRCSEIEFKYYDEAAKQCALICAEQSKKSAYLTVSIIGEKSVVFWQQVKEAISNL